MSISNLKAIVSSLRPNNKQKNTVLGLEINTEGFAVAFVDEATDKSSTNTVKNLSVQCERSEVAERLKSILKDVDTQHERCKIVLHPDLYEVMVIDRPNVDDDELKSACQWAVKDMVSGEITDYAVDTFGYPKDAVRGGTDKINVVVCKKEIVQHCIDVTQFCALDLVSIDVADLVSCSLAAHQLNDPNTTAAIVCVRQGTSIVSFTKGNSHYFTRSIDFDISRLSDPTSQEIVLQQLGLELQRSFDYLESQMGQLPPRKLIVLSPSSKIPLSNMLDGIIPANVEAVPFDQNQFGQVEDCTDFSASAMALGATIEANIELAEAI